MFNAIEDRVWRGLAAFVLAAACVVSMTGKQAIAVDDPDPATSQLVRQLKGEYAKKNYLNAMIYADRIIQAHPDHQLGHFYRAMILHSLKNAKEARLEYEFAAGGKNQEIAKRAQQVLISLGGKVAPRAAAPAANKPIPGVKSDPTRATTPGVTTAVTPSNSMKPSLLMYLSDDPTSNELRAIMIDIERKYGSKVRIAKINIEDVRNRIEMEKYNVEDAPLAIFLDKDGRETERTDNFAECKTEFGEKLDALLK